MSWEMASFVVLGVVLLAGFGWYERSRPPSQTVALVAAMAALAVAGRVALAPLPNVVATTDIVIFTGFAIGAAPGFAVGALAGLVSNFWLGQGPWTPWQMAAWGLAGILGAVLCLLTAGKPNRFVLASACGVMGVAFGAVMNFSLMASYGGELTLDRFLALEARAVPFDAAHVIGNVTLALIAGPAMVRMLVRFRERFEWRRAKPRGVVVSGATMLLAVLLFAAPVQAADVDAAVGWLKTAQNTDGGFPGTPGEDSSVAMTGWAMLGLESAGTNPLDVAKGSHSPVTYLRAHSGDITTTGDLARTTLALTAAGVDVRNFQNRNLVTALRSRMTKNGSWQRWPNLTAFAIMALRGADSPKGLDHSVDWLRDVQGDDGGWGDVARSPSNADSTGAVLQVVGGPRASRDAVAYLRHNQFDGGGYRLGDAGVLNSQSTAWAVQGLIASGVNPDNVRRGGGSGLDFLDRMQAEDGHFRYSRSSNVTPVWVTGQALVAVTRSTFPLDVVARTEPKLGPATSAGDASAPPPSYTAPLRGLGDYGGSPSYPSYPSGSGTSSSGVGGTGGGGGNQKKSGTAGANSPSIGPVAPVPDTSKAAGSTLTKGSPAAFTTGPSSGPAPLPPIAIGIGTGLAAIIGTWFLGRRRVW